MELTDIQVKNLISNILNEDKNYVNMDVDVRDGGRNAVKMTEDEFKQEMIHAYHMYAMEQEKKYKYDLHLTPTPDSFVYSLCYKNRDNEKSKYTSALYDDIWGGKYKFDSENVDAYGGIKMSKKGFPYIQCAAGGDWECPVCFFVYFDGTHFRGYVPLKGNAINRNNNTAFQGNGDEEEVKFIAKEMGIDFEEAKSLTGDIKFNKDACLKDFLSRVEVKGSYKKRDHTKDEEKFKAYRKEKIAEEERQREEAERRRQMNAQETNGEPDGSEEMNETVRNILSKFASPYILNESQESKSIDAAKRLFMQRTGKSAEEADKFVRVDLRNDLPVLRDKNCAKFILGVTRMFLDRQLTDASTIQNLNKTLKLLTQGHFNEYDRNLNGMSAQDVIQRFSTAMKQMDDQEREELGNMQFTENGDYQIVRIDDFEQASQYGQYTSWCVTHDENMFNSYTSNGLGQFYFCLRNGFENEPEQVGEGCPLDSYGLSMIAVSVDESGRLNTCTCRWNHDNGGDDNIMDVKQISQVIGRNFFEVFKPNGKWQGIVDDAINRLRNGESPKDVFKYVGDFCEGLVKVRLNDKWNWITKDNRILSKKWYDVCGDFIGGLAVVYLNGKCNWVRRDNGQLLCNQWFDRCWDFTEGLAVVGLNDEWNWVRADNGQLLSNQWYYYCAPFHEGLAGAVLNGKKYLMRRDGVLCDYETKEPIQQQSELNEMVMNMLNKFIFEVKATADEVYQKYYSNIDHNVFNAAIAADPTAKNGGMGKYTKWILNLINKGLWEPGDSYETRNCLERFAKIGARLPKKDIQQYQSLDELYQAIQDASDVKTRSEVKCGGAEKVYEDSDWVVIHPKTEEAAIYYGRGTMWCTSSTDAYNSFNDFNEDGPLYIIISKDDPNMKWQFHVESNQFKNVYDTQVDATELDMYGDPDGLFKFIQSIDKNFQFFFDIRRKKALRKLNKGVDPNNIFDEVWSANNGFSKVKLNNKWNYIKYNPDKSKYSVLSRRWFDDCYLFYNGFAPVVLNNQHYYIDTNGKLYKEKPTQQQPGLNEMVMNILNKFIFEDGGGATSDCGGGLPGEFVAPAFGGADKDFIEPTLDRTPGDTCGMHDRVGKSNLEEKRKKVVKNDEGKVVPEFCKKCGGKVGTYICGEPIYKCSECGEYYGTVPFTLGRKKNIKESKQSWRDNPLFTIGKYKGIEKIKVINSEPDYCLWLHENALDKISNTPFSPKELALLDVSYYRKYKKFPIRSPYTPKYAKINGKYVSDMDKYELQYVWEHGNKEFKWLVRQEHKNRGWERRNWGAPAFQSDDVGDIAWMNRY